MIKYNKKILVAEDEEINLMIAEHTLKKMGFEVGTANNGEAVVAKLLSEKFFMILMDIEMPIMDGLEAAQLIRQSLLERNPHYCLDSPLTPR